MYLLISLELIIYVFIYEPAGGAGARRSARRRRTCPGASMAMIATIAIITTIAVIVVIAVIAVTAVIAMCV